jgi:C-terminal processing protease CtpA/Prc
MMRFILLSFISVYLLGWEQLQAESALNPSLGVVFPVQVQEGKLVLRSTMLLNGDDVLPAGTVLHKLFPRPKQDDKDVKSRKFKNYNTDKYAAVQRAAIENREVDQDKSAVLKATMDRAGGEPMTDELKFRAMLHRMSIEEYYLAYDLAGQKDRRIGQFEFPEGLFLAEQNSRVLVLAVLPGSEADKLGILPGSWIQGLNGKPLASLVEFRDRYYKEKEEKKSRQEALVMKVSHPESGEVKDLEFQLKRSLGSAEDLMSDLSQAGKEVKQVKETVTPTPKTTPPEEAPLILIP